MKNIIVVGASGHAAEINDYLAYNEKITGIKEFNLLGFLDDNEAYYHKYAYPAPFLGPITNHEIQPDIFYIIAIANVKIRKMVVEDYLSRGAKFTGFIHCMAYISASAKIGEGVVIAPYANVGPNAVIGDFTLLNSRCSVAHDCVVGQFNFITPNVSLSGNTQVGDCNTFGINSATIPGICIGNRNKIEAGMIVEKNIGDDSVIFHKFKERVIAIPKQSL